MILTCYPPCQVIGGLYGCLLVVDAKVHHVDMTIAGAGGWWRQKTLQIRGECKDEIMHHLLNLRNSSNVALGVRSQTERLETCEVKSWT